jgi:hypothetical protein
MGCPLTVHGHLTGGASRFPLFGEVPTIFGYGSVCLVLSEQPVSLFFHVSSWLALSWDVPDPCALQVVGIP